MTAARHRVARLGEDAAAQYLSAAGWRIVHRNYRCSQGEIDIVAEDGPDLVFVEVRTRSSAAFGAPEESLTAAKAQKMAACALAYLQAHPESRRAWRLDFVAVEVAGGRVSRLEHFKHALQ
jgi:putative endonuclease